MTLSRSETHVFWSEDYSVQIKDFQDTAKSSKNVAWCENNNLCWGAYTGLFSVMDISKNKKDE
ncbi:MAG: hypothetical protein IPL55_14945 [Saprospiraceae bacterium]|jgi:hypothetical protein|nr:hypothetical protein [Saprospiraceae bacterium]MBL0026350.1 hypothetical protein [Saprospiraceae bacterium]